jgi:hypothetical protein
MCLRRESESIKLKIPWYSSSTYTYFVDDQEQVCLYTWLQFFSSSRGCKFSVTEYVGYSIILLAVIVSALCVWYYSILNVKEKRGVRFVVHDFQQSWVSYFQKVTSVYLVCWMGPISTESYPLPFILGVISAESCLLATEVTIKVIHWLF